MSCHQGTCALNCVCDASPSSYVCFRVVYNTRDACVNVIARAKVEVEATEAVVTTAGVAVAAVEMTSLDDSSRHTREITR